MTTLIRGELIKATTTRTIFAYAHEDENADPDLGP